MMMMKKAAGEAAPRRRTLGSRDLCRVSVCAGELQVPFQSVQHFFWEAIGNLTRAKMDISLYFSLHFWV